LEKQAAASVGNFDATPDGSERRARARSDRAEVEKEAGAGRFQKSWTPSRVDANGFSSCVRTCTAFGWRNPSIRLLKITLLIRELRSDPSAVIFNLSGL
jgi:hypothetical protein